MFANYQKLNNLVAIIDCNKIQKMGPVKDIIGINSWKTRFKSFGWIVEEVDGHNINQLDEVLKKENDTEHPKVIIANTIKGKGVSIIEGNSKWHWRLPNRRELKTFMEELNISEEEILQCKKPI